VNPKDDGQILRSFGCIDIKDVSLVAGFDVRDVDFRFCALSVGSKRREDNEGEHDSHGGTSESGE
jgi:hypothetical protein